MITVRNTLANLRVYLTLSLVIAIVNVFGINLPNAKPQTPVLDLSNTLTISQQQSLTNDINQIYRYESKTDIQIVIIPSLENTPIEELALNTARKWRLGQKGLNNGLLFLIAIKDKQYRIEVGYGLEGVLPDGYIGNLERSIVAPNFQKGDYYTGIHLAIINLGARISKEYKTSVLEANKLNHQNKLSPVSIFILIIVLIAFVILIIYCVITGNYQLLYNIMFFIIQIIIMFSGRGGGGGNNRRDSDGDFGGGGTSGRW